MARKFTADEMPDAKVLMISVAAKMAGMHPQTLRQYDRLGLVEPGRTPGGGRRYSVRDVALLREVQQGYLATNELAHRLHNRIGPSAG